MRNFGFLKNYLIFALVVMILLLPIYGEAYRLLERETEAHTRQSIERGAVILSDEIQSVNGIIIRVPSNQYFGYVRSWESPGRSEDYYAMYSIKNYMADITAALSLPCQNMLWFSNGLIVTPETVYSRPEQCGYQLFHTSREKNVRDWFTSFAGQGYRYRFMEAEQFTDWRNGDYTALPLVYTYSSLESNEIAVWVSLFDLDTIYRLLGLEEIKDRIRMRINSTETGELLYDNGVEIKGKAREFQGVTETASLGFTVEIPRNYFTDQMTGMWLIAGAYLALFVLAALVMALVLARKTAVPVHKIVNILSRYAEEDGAEPDNYADIERSIVKIGDKGRAVMDAHGRLNEELYKWLLREQIVGGLEGKSLKEVAAKGKILQGPFRLLLLQITGKDQKVDPGEAERLAQESGIEPIFFCRAKEKLFLCLIREENRETLYGKLNRLIAAAETVEGRSCIVSVSVVMNSLEHIHERYQSGRYSMKYLSVRKVIFQDEVGGQAAPDGPMPDLTESVKLTDLILNGRREEAEAVISGQWYQVSMAREYALMEQLYYMQTAVLNRAATRLGCENRAAALQYNDVIADAEQKMLEFAGELCDLALRKKQDAKNELPGKIVSYIDAHYTDPAFYLGTLTDVFGLSDKTITKLIRGYCNQNFSSYLEELRIKRARILLEDRKLSIAMIAQKSGFGSENTFYKAFKRVYNVSPGTYRDNLQELERPHATMSEEP